MKNSITVSLSLGVVVLSGCAQYQSRGLASNSAFSDPASMGGADAGEISTSSSDETRPAQRIEAIAGDEPSMGPSVPTASAEAGLAYANNATVSAERLRNWRLTEEDLMNELQTSDQVVRTRTMNPGEPADPADSRVHELIAIKLNNNPDTSGLPLQVNIDDGVARLSGAANSPAQIGKAMALALDTPGVLRVVSMVRIDATVAR